MKLYIIRDHRDGFATDGEGHYHLVTEKGELLFSHVSTNRDWAYGDLTYKNFGKESEQERINILNEKFGKGNWTIEHFTNDIMSDDEFIEVARKNGHIKQN
jgi:hypothetical protein